MWQNPGTYKAYYIILRWETFVASISVAYVDIWNNIFIAAAKTTEIVKDTTNEQRKPDMCQLIV